MLPTEGEGPVAAGPFAGRLLKFEFRELPLGVLAIKMNDAAIDYVRKYLSGAEFVSLTDLSDREKGTLPKHWIDVLSKRGAERLKETLASWFRFRDVLPGLVDKLGAELQSVELLRHKGTLSLVYEVNYNGKEIFYQSGNPITEKRSNTIERLWPLLPQRVRDFYEFADGWYYLASHSMGLSAFADVFCLADEEWGILDDIGPQPVNLEKTLALFTNGQFGYVCIDLGKANASGLVWWSDRAPKLDQDFWAVVDAWTVIGLEKQ